MATTSNPTKARVFAQVRPWLPWLAAALAVLALWLAWSGWRGLQEDTRRTSVTLARDTVAGIASTTLRGEMKRLQDRLASPPVQAALQAGDLEIAGRLLAADWPDVELAQVHLADLGTMYAALPDAGYGPVSVMEAALVKDEPVVSVIRVGDAPRVALAAPVRVDGQPAGVAFVRLPLSRATQGFEGADVDPATYVALRQGGFTLLEQGDLAQAEAAERMAVPVPGTELRVAASLPRTGSAPFGLQGIPLFIAVIGLLLLAYLLWRVPTRLQRALAVDAPSDDAAAPTLADALALGADGDADPSGDGAQTKPVIAIKDTPKPMPVDIDRSIFRAYDIRGIVGQTLDAGVAELIGHSVGSLMQEQGLADIVIGRDGRLSGPDMVAGLVRGLRRAGRNVIDIGMAPTPVIYFGAFHLRTGCCISVTGSHNPPDYNGFKIVVGGETLSGDTITDLYARIADGRLHDAPAPGDVSERDIADAYVQRIADDIQLARPLKVVVDAGNGVAGEIGPRVLEAIGAEVIPLFCEIDGTFPNHHPDPSEPHNLVDLIGTVKRFDADLGIAFDGDGDRLGVVTKDGENIYPDRLLMLFAADVLDRNPGAVIVYDVKCTGRLPGHILRHGGSPLMWKTGHSLIKAKMRETEAELAGEMSGHFFFQERWYGFDDGIYAAARLLEILALDPGDPSEALNALPGGVSTPEIKVEVADGNPHGFVERFQQQARFEGARASTIDGLRVDWNDGWGLVRASNTTPVLVLRFDADDQEALDRILADFRAQIALVDPELQLPF
ncbi:phosphomannomutase/phosphoglucomutase [Luteimonas viscosa]|uniref:phosphomannomutase n=1 Tax=Luteimonas viscosa TaxID=1132694 RepID=A0A5D4XSK8_9GAMM|nr:phosphomannomutase/phosphoglucomutase [Luteimonas viscosa]TYT26671.1 phosphomannomutase/phosphoglucomutase [Luteimonas viscosa]